MKKNHEPGAGQPDYLNPDLPAAPRAQDLVSRMTLAEKVSQMTMDPFGFGLSYTRFRYSGLSIGPNPARAGMDLEVEVDVENAGGVAGDEVVQVYVSGGDRAANAPVRKLAGFARMRLNPGEKRRVGIRIAAGRFNRVDEEGKIAVSRGTFKVSVGGCQPGFEAMHCGSTEVLESAVEIR